MKNFLKKLLLPAVILFCGIAIYGIVSFVGADELSGTDPVVGQSGNTEVVYQPLEGPNWQAIYTAVGNALWASGISNNFDYVTADNVSAFPNLNLWTSNGMISFLTNIDLTDGGIQSFLQALPNSFSLEDGYVNFTPTGNGSGFNMPAKIEFWNMDPPFIGDRNAKDFLISKNNEGQILSGSDLNTLFGNNDIIHCDMGEGYYCNFYVNHFTSFKLFTPPAPGILPYRAGPAPDGFTKLVDDITNPQYMLYMRTSPVSLNGYSYAEMQSYVPNKNEALPTTALMNILVSSNHTTTWVAESGIMLDPGNRPDRVSDTTGGSLMSVSNDVEVDGQPDVSQGPYFISMAGGDSARIRTIYTTYYDAPVPFSCDNVTDVSQSECEVLVDLYNSTDGDNWDTTINPGPSTPWMSSYQVCDWYGITCNGSTIQNISLSNDNLLGTVEISGLTGLARLDLNNNNISSINLSGLTALTYLDLAGSNVSSLHLDGLSNLVSFFAYYNELSTIDFAGLINLEVLDVKGNNLSHLDLDGLTTLSDVNANNNKLTSISFSGLTNLETADFSSNWLTRVDNLDGAPNITYLDVSSNLLATVPESIMDLTFDTLSISNNCRDTEAMSSDLLTFLDSNADDTGRSSITNDACYNDPKEVDALIDLYNATDGPNGRDTNDNWGDRSVPLYDWYGVQTNEGMHVYRLALSNNYLSGAIPASFGDLTQLQILNLQGNGITSLPESFGTLTGLYLLDLRSNHLSSLPSTFGNLVNLDRAFLQDNWIRSLPSNFGNIIGGGDLIVRLDGNRLTDLPDSFANLTGLARLTLYNNCIYDGRLSSDVYNFLFVEPPFQFQRGNQEANCPTTNVLDTNGAWENMTNDIYIYDYTNPATNFTTTGGTLTVRDENRRATDYLNFSTDGFTINVVDGTWDGMLYSPTEYSDPVLGTEKLPLPSGVDGNTTTNRVILFTTKAGASGSSLQASGGLFTISFRVADGTNGEFLHIYRSSDHVTWENNTPDSGCTLTDVEVGPLGHDWLLDKVCTFHTDHLSYFTTVRETTTINTNQGGGGGGGTIAKDNCPNGDTSTSFYDGKCDTIGTTTNGAEVKLGSLAGSPFIEEINNAYLYAYNLGITSSPTILGADIEGQLIRSHMAKMMVNYAIKVMGLTPDTTKTCSFDDIGNQPTDMQAYITLSCQLGLMGIDMTSFDPDGVVTRAQFGTILSRTLFGDKYNGSTPYYEAHLAALKEAGIMTSIANAEIVNEIRGYVMLMLMRADQ